MDCSGVAARDILSLFLCLLSATLHSCAVYILYIFIHAHIFSPFGFHSFVSSFFPAKAHSLLLPKSSFHLIAFCIFPIWFSFILYHSQYTCISLRVFHTVFYSTVNILPAFYLSIFTFWAVLFLLVLSVDLCLSTSSIFSVLLESVRQDA